MTDDEYYLSWSRVNVDEERPQYALDQLQTYIYSLLSKADIEGVLNRMANAYNRLPPLPEMLEHCTRHAWVFWLYFTEYGFMDTSGIDVNIWKPSLPHIARLIVDTRWVKQSITVIKPSTHGFRKNI